MNSSIWHIDGTLADTTNLSHSGPGSNGNEGVHHIPQSSRAGASLTIRCSLVSFRTLIGEEVLTSQQQCSWHILQSHPLGHWINVLVQNFLKVTNYNRRYLKKAGGYSARNIVSITTKMRTIIRIIWILFQFLFFFISSTWTKQSEL